MLHAVRIQPFRRAHPRLCRFHSHPFDANALDEQLGKDDHCWFSQIDVSNQLSWQQAFETMDGIPFVGIVVDPKTSCQRRRLVLRPNREPVHALATAPSPARSRFG